MLYDIRKLDAVSSASLSTGRNLSNVSSSLQQEPFAEIAIQDPILAGQSWPPRTPIYTSAKFSFDGKYILVGTSSGVHYVLHSFNNVVVARLEGVYRYKAVLSNEVLADNMLIP